MNPAGLCEELIKSLNDRFEKNMNRNKSLDWAKIQAKLEANPELNETERTVGELTSLCEKRLSSTINKSFKTRQFYEQFQVQTKGKNGQY